MAGTISLSNIQADSNGTVTISTSANSVMYTISNNTISYANSLAIPAPKPNVQSNTFNSGTSQTWTKPANASFVKIELWGGGGSGGHGDSSACGGGGGGGAYNTITIPFASILGNITYTIASGGAARSGKESGLAGGTTTITFDSLFGISNVSLSAYGGGGGGENGGEGSSYGGGGGGSRSTGGSGNNRNEGGAPLGGRDMNNLVTATYTDCSSVSGGGSGGQGRNPQNDVFRNGGSSFFGGGGGGGGFNGTSSNTSLHTGGSSFYGGGGGGGGSTNTPGSLGGTSIFGGRGGNGATTGTAQSGTAPAGGGGGCTTGTSGAGAAGRVVFSWW